MTPSIAIPRIELDRNFPPVPSGLTDELRSSMGRLADRADLATLTRYHRYGDLEADQAASAQWLSARFGAADLYGRIVLTNGTKNGVLLVLSLLAGPGDVVVTEALSALRAWALPQLLGISVIGTAIDAEGIVPEAFERLCKDARPKALFTVPTLHNPTTHVLGIERRRAIAEIADRYGVVIVEDDICGMLLPDAPPPFATLAPGRAWFVTGVGKAISPGFRLGHVVAPSVAEARAFIARFRSTTTWVPSPISAEIVADWIVRGTAVRMLDAIREEIAARQAIAAEAFAGLDAVTSPFSLNVWLRLPPTLLPAALIAAASQQGISLGSTTLFRTDAAQPDNSVRVCLGGPKSIDELQQALAIVARLSR